MVSATRAISTQRSKSNQSKSPLSIFRRISKPPFSPLSPSLSRHLSPFSKTASQPRRLSTMPTCGNTKLLERLKALVESWPSKQATSRRGYGINVLYSMGKARGRLGAGLGREKKPQECGISGYNHSNPKGVSVWFIFSDLHSKYRVHGISGTKEMKFPLKPRVMSAKILGGMRILYIYVYILIYSLDICSYILDFCVRSAWVMDVKSSGDTQ